MDIIVAVLFAHIVGQLANSNIMGLKGPFVPKCEECHFRGSLLADFYVGSLIDFIIKAFNIIENELRPENLIQDFFEVISVNLDQEIYIYFWPTSWKVHVSSLGSIKSVFSHFGNFLAIFWCCFFLVIVTRR